MYILWILIAYLALYLVRTIIGPSVWDRVLGLNLISTKIILLIIVFASVNNDSNMLDFAIIYALSGFIGTIFIAMFLANRIKADKAKRGEK